MIKYEISIYLSEFAILNILLPVKEPIWDLVLTRVVHDGDDLLNLSDNKQKRY